MQCNDVDVVPSGHYSVECELRQTAYRAGTVFAHLCLVGSITRNGPNHGKLIRLNQGTLKMLLPYLLR